MKKRILAVFLTLAIILTVALPVGAVSMPRPNHLLINQVYGRDNAIGAAISHSFIELYNPTAAAISIDGWSLKYCVFGDNWEVFELSGAIPVAHSYLIIGNSADNIGSRYNIMQYDALWAQSINNDRFKIALINENGTVVDMVGAGVIDDAEGEPILGISKQKTARRIKFSDINDNASDFEILDYRVSGIDVAALQAMRPRSLADGAHSANIFPDDIVPESKQLMFSHDAGMYQNPFNLTMMTAYTDAVVRYTTDGSDPTAASTKYTAPIMINNRTADNNKLANITNIIGGGPGYSPPSVYLHKGRVIKAAVFSNSGTQLTNTETKSYFVHPEIFGKYGDLPIISIVTEQKNLFDNSIGLYVNGNWNHKGETWERPAHFELIEPDGTVGISQNMGVRIQGAWSRNFSLKSLRFYARKKYDEKNPNIEYDLLDGDMKDYYGNNIENFENFILRNSGNDFDGVMFRDAFMQRIAKNTNVDMQGYRPAAAFINGEFWGLYNIRQRVDNHLPAAKFDIDANMIASYEISGTEHATLNDGDQSDIDYYNQMYSFFQNGNFTSDSMYEQALTYIDEDNIIDYYITNIFVNNSDWPWNNCKFWRYKADGYDPYAPPGMDGRFRFILSDTDFGFGLSGGYEENLLNRIISQGHAAYGSRIFRRLLQNETFKNKFINRFCDLLNTEFNRDIVRQTLESTASKVYTIMPDHINRWRNISGMNNWSDRLNYMISFAGNRPANIRNHLRNQWGLGGDTSLTLSCDKQSGYLKINAVDIKETTNNVYNAGNWSGIYFANSTQVITAKPAPGYRLEKFIVTTGSSSQEYTSDTISVTLSAQGNSVEAIFVPDGTLPTPVTGVNISKAAATMDIGSAAHQSEKTLQLTAEVLPENATVKDVTWTSSDTNIMTVDQNGLCTALAEGQATVTVTTADGGYFARCIITVNATMLPTLKIKANPNVFLTMKEDSILGFLDGISAGDLKSDFDAGDGEIAIFDQNGQQLFDDDFVENSYQIKLFYDGEALEIYSFVDLGEVTGDGMTDINDIMAIRAVILYGESLSGVYETAADTNLDGKINLIDILRIRKFILG